MPNFMLQFLESLEILVKLFSYSYNYIKRTDNFLSLEIKRIQMVKSKHWAF